MTKKQEQAAEAATTPEITGETEARPNTRPRAFTAGRACAAWHGSTPCTPAATPRRRWTSL